MDAFELYQLLLLYIFCYVHFHFPLNPMVVTALPRVFCKHVRQEPTHKINKVEYW